jgi:hypothetical protein
MVAPNTKPYRLHEFEKLALDIDTPEDMERLRELEGA